MFLNLNLLQPSIHVRCLRKMVISRAVECIIQRSHVRFLLGTQNFSWSHANDEEIKFFIISLPSSKFAIFLIRCTNMMLSTMLIPQADHTMCLWLMIVDMRQTKSMRVLTKALHCISKLHLGLNNLIKFNKMLIHSFEEFFRLHRLFEVTFYKITFGQKTQTTNT